MHSLLYLLLCAGASAAPPQLYSRVAYQSPVHGGPDDLLLIAGYGFSSDDTVVYRTLANTSRLPTSPDALPTHSSADVGMAEVVSSAGVPYSLTIKLPQSMRPGEPYALWVRTAHGEWSQAVTINDARPLWFSPAYIHASGSIASLPREIKVVGRNLRPSSRHATQIKLAGPQDYTASAVVDSESRDTDDYLTRIPLPVHLAPGRYRVLVNRDGANWVEVIGQSLDVLPDQRMGDDFAVGDPRYGGCRPDDGADDTACIVRAVAAAQRAGGGSVYFGPGTWDLIDGSQQDLIAGEGIVVPAGVQLRGAGSTRTRVQRHAEWNARAPTAAFTLVGPTLVRGFTFIDLQLYQPSDAAGPFLQLGEDYSRAASSPKQAADAREVSNVIITRNIFDKTLVAIGTGGLPINRLFITHNRFGAYRSALELSGDPFNVIQRYRIDDSVIDYNIFLPGSELDLIHKTGTIASELGAGYRVDFSNNTADGSSTDYLYSAEDARGWRAAFFWNLNGNIEEMLVSHNTATCTGDKIGDGEAIAFDNNANTFAFSGAAVVVRSSTDSIGVSAPLVARQNNRNVAADNYYIGHWMQVVGGPGIGQARKIIGYSTDPGTRETTFSVAPAWDVVPAPGQSRVTVGREFWQLYAVGNHIDNRQPMCQKSNRSRRAAGQIVLWAQSADSVIADNRQYDSDGIFVQQAYILPEHSCADCTMQGYVQAFLEIDANLIDGKYDWNSDCSASGIAAGIGAAPWGTTAPPTVGFGVSISHNTIRHADAQYGGAIAQLNSWYPGPPPHRWPLSDNLLIHHNSISDIGGARAMAVCGTGHARIGIAFPDPGIAWRTVLYANSCRNVAVPIGAGGIDIKKICSASVTDSCECGDVNQ